MVTQNGAVNGELKDSVVMGHTSQGVEIRASLLRLARYLAVFEIYNSALILRASEVLSDFRIVIGERSVYSGRAVVSSLINAGTVLICEVTLEDAWLETDSFLTCQKKGGAGFNEFLQQWQKVYKVSPEFKVVV